MPIRIRRPAARLAGAALVAGAALAGAAAHAIEGPPLGRNAKPIDAPIPGTWPAQEAPAAFRVVFQSNPGDDSDDFPQGRPAALQVLAASLGGVAARAVNEGRHDELLWMPFRRPSYDMWLAEGIARNGLEERPAMAVLDAVAHYRGLGLVHGYIVYRRDGSPGGAYTDREGIDHSANVATMLAAANDGVLVVEESIEDEVAALGLQRVLDARGLPWDEAFESVRGRLSRDAILTIDPRVHNLRDIAIAQRLGVAFGTGADYQRLLAHARPNTPVLGWNAGDEAGHTAPPSRRGLVQVPTNWCMNLPFTSAGAHRFAPARWEQPPRPAPGDPGRAEAFAAFMISDGDNIQWMMRGFVDSDGYWPTPLRGRNPVGWSVGGVKASQASPGTWEHIVRTATPNDDLIEFSGGYFFPDLFGADTGRRPAVLRRHADMLAARMEATGTRVLTFICDDVSSPESMEAYRAFAERIPFLVGMVAIQYHPYNGGHGEVFWAEDGRGGEVPVLTARYALWEHATWEGSGTPARIARLINEHSAEQLAEGASAHSLVSVHAWSNFQRAPGDDEDAENVPPRADGRRGPGLRALHPIDWTIERLDPQVRVVTPEEMLMRLRAERQHANTKEAGQ